MRHLDRLATIGIALAAIGTAAPAWAGVATPAPIAGVGVGAVLLLGAGYRLLKRRIDR